MTISISNLLALLIEYKYAILFPALIIEGPMATLLAAFLSSAAGGNILNIIFVFYIVVVADIVGDVFYYSIGRFGKRYIIKKWGRQIGISDDKLIRFENYFKKHGVKTLALAKVSHGIGWAAMVGAGSAHMPFQRFIVVSSVVSIPKSLLLITLGYYYGKSYEILSQYISTTALMVTTILIFVFLVYLFHFRGNGKTA
jgi:membrane-associated protein